MAGIITEVGEGVTDFKVGDEVYGFAGGVKGMGGAVAEYMLADTRLLARKPKKLIVCRSGRPASRFNHCLGSVVQSCQDSSWR